jgi:hypothetical protein
VDLGRFFSFLIYTQSVGLLGQGISPSQGRYLHIDIHASSGIRTQDPSFPEGEDGSCFTPGNHCDQQLNICLSYLQWTKMLNRTTDIPCKLTANASLFLRLQKVRLTGLREVYRCLAVKGWGTLCLFKVRCTCGSLLRALGHIPISPVCGETWGKWKLIAFLLINLPYSPADGGSMFLRNVGESYRNTWSHVTEDSSPREPQT